MFRPIDGQTARRRIARANRPFSSWYSRARKTPAPGANLEADAYPAVPAAAARAPAVAGGREERGTPRAPIPIAAPPARVERPIEREPRQSVSRPPQVTSCPASSRVIRSHAPANPRSGEPIIGRMIFSTTPLQMTPLMPALAIMAPMRPPNSA